MSRSKRAPAWSDTNVPVIRSLNQIRELLQAYGADRWSFPEDNTGDIQIYFELRGIPVNLTLHAKQMHHRLREYHTRTRDSELLERAKRIIARQAVNYLKVTFEVMETGLFSPIEALLPHMTDSGGRRVVDIAIDSNPSFRKLLTEG